MLKCQICGKAGNYSQMIDYNLYSVHPQCEEKILLLLLPIQNQITTIKKDFIHVLYVKRIITKSYLSQN
ncbi:hypothetical protein BH18THE2_BH18THE2_07330 [soil metagenome]